MEIPFIKNEFSNYLFICNLIIFLIFSKNGSNWLGGIENVYSDPCQEWLDLTNKKLTSPNYPDRYDPNTVCKWNLTTEKGNYISLDFEHIDVSDRDMISNV